MTESAQKTCLVCLNTQPVAADTCGHCGEASWPDVEQALAADAGEVPVETKKKGKGKKSKSPSVPPPPADAPDSPPDVEQALAADAGESGS